MTCACMMSHMPLNAERFNNRGSAILSMFRDLLENGYGKRRSLKKIDVHKVLTFWFTRSRFLKNLNIIYLSFFCYFKKGLEYSRWHVIKWSIFILVLYSTQVFCHSSTTLEHSWSHQIGERFPRQTKVYIELCVCTIKFPYTQNIWVLLNIDIVKFISFHMRIIGYRLTF